MQFVAYYRVSTDKQGIRGLGMEAQQISVRQFVEREGGEIVASFMEVESGKKADRPELEKAIGFTRRIKGRLVIAKLDRLARNVAFTSALMESGLDFVACDYPQANKLTIHIMAAMAEHERQMISTRTKEAMAVAKSRGAVFGSARPGHWEGREDRRRIGQERAVLASAKARGKQAFKMVLDVLPELRQRRSSGQSLRTIARGMNESHTGRLWNPMSVSSALQRTG